MCWMNDSWSIHLLHQTKVFSIFLAVFWNVWRWVQLCRPCKRRSPKQKRSQHVHGEDKRQHQEENHGTANTGRFCHRSMWIDSFKKQLWTNIHYKPISSLIVSHFFHWLGTLLADSEYNHQNRNIGKTSKRNRNTVVGVRRVHQYICKGQSKSR